MDTKEKWKSICYLLEINKQYNTLEGAYQRTVEKVFDLLGWNEMEICSQFPVQMGVSTKKADIVLKNKDKKVIVVEIKRPNAETNEQVQNQLSSYMGVLRLNFGICIGENLKLFYDNPKDKEEDIELIFETDFDVESENGLKFIELFSKSTFDEEKLTAFCDEKLDYLNDIRQAKGLLKDVKKLEEYLFSKLREEFNDDILRIIKDKIKISVIPEQPINSYKIQNDKMKMIREKSGPMPIELIPADPEEFKRKFLEKGVAKMRFYYQDNSIEEKDWTKNLFKESSGVLGNLRSRPIARDGKWKEEGIVKLVVEVID